jgi:hypothetical protein
MSTAKGSAVDGGGEKHAAGAFDVRNVIAGLIGLYGVVLVIVGIVDRSAEALEKAGGVNANLWAGVAMIVVAAGFALWSRLRPIIVEAPRTSDGDRPGH